MIDKTWMYRERDFRVEEALYRLHERSGDPRSYHAVREIAHEAEISETTVRRALQDLAAPIQHGTVIATDTNRRGSESGGWRYRLTDEAYERLAKEA
jgi:predicted transcriptional regulator